MSNVQVLDVMYQALQLMMRLSLPFLIISMAVGGLVAIFQAARASWSAGKFHAGNAPGFCQDDF